MSSSLCQTFSVSAKTVHPLAQVSCISSSFIVIRQLQEQAGQLQKYLQQLGQLPAFQKGLEQALGKSPGQHLQADHSHTSTRPKPRVPISGMLLPHHCFL